MFFMAWMAKGYIKLGFVRVYKFFIELQGKYLAFGLCFLVLRLQYRARQPDLQIYLLSKTFLIPRFST